MSASAKDPVAFQPSRLEEWVSDKAIIIHGAGHSGRLLLKTFEAIGVEVSFIWDNKSDLVEPVNGYEVAKPTFDAVSDKKNTIVFVAITSKKIAEAVANTYAIQGFSTVFSDPEFIGDLIQINCSNVFRDNTADINLRNCEYCPKGTSQIDRCQIFEKISAGFQSNNIWSQDYIVMNKLGVLVNNRCNLKCLGCNHLRHLYEEKSNPTLDQEHILEDVRKIAESVDVIAKVTVVGGEALLTKSLPSTIRGIHAIENIKSIELITNGTVVPKNPEVFTALAETNTFVQISGYDHQLNDKLKNAVGLFMDRLIKYGIEHRYVRNLEWFNFGDFSFRGYDDKTWSKTFETCCSISNDLFDGRLFKCSRGAFAPFLGKVPLEQSDHVDVRNSSSARELRKSIQSFLLNKKPNICQYCNGVNGDVIEAGVQTEVVEG